ncbi:hypothetical protein VNO78_23896 [Psophocarpus tetragonolobus]|uniref:Uncharacterized protein n=1 Tax=Psophocarpus tetragonolobus TaxID=3891 RepID=A0AAN9S7J4_PSOTE
MDAGTIAEEITTKDILFHQLSSDSWERFHRGEKKVGEWVGVDGREVIVNVVDIRGKANQGRLVRGPGGPFDLFEVKNMASCCRSLDGALRARSTICGGMRHAPFRVDVVGGLLKNSGAGSHAASVCINHSQVKTIEASLIPNAFKVRNDENPHAARVGTNAVHVRIIDDELSLNAIMVGKKKNHVGVMREQCSLPHSPHKSGIDHGSRMILDMISE